MPGETVVRRWIALPLVLLGMLLPAASANAAFSLSGLVAQPNDVMQAGGHPNFHIHLGVTGDEDIQSLTTQLPPGLVGNPLAPGLAFCTQQALNANSCLPTSQVGTTTSNVTINGLISQDVPGAVYNVIPNPGEPGRLGIVLQANVIGVNLSDPIILQGAISTRPDFGLNTTINGLPNMATLTIPLLGGLLPAGLPVSTHINSIDLVLSNKFMRNPTSCNQATTVFNAVSYSNTPASGTASFTPTNCLGQAYNPMLSVEVDMSKGADYIDNPELTTEVTQGLDEADSRRVEAIMPTTLQANNGALNNQCPESAFNVSDSSTPAGCPANTRVGTAVAKTPLLQAPLQGPVYLIQNVGLLPRIGLDLRGPLPAKLFGNVTPTQTFRLDNVFGDPVPLPPVPLSNFRLTFNGGKGGLITATKALCAGDPNQFDAIFDSHGGHHVTRTGKAKVIGCAFKKRLEKNRCDHKKLTDVGTKHRDTIRGTKKRDVINGLGGRDKIVGLKGNDLLCGGKGKDKIAGGPGKDKMFGGAGRDLLVGGAGKDKLAGGPGKDRQRQ